MSAIRTSHERLLRTCVSAFFTSLSRICGRVIACAPCPRDRLTRFLFTHQRHEDLTRVVYCSAVIAHEMAHVYMWLNDFPELAAPVEEGVCELIKFLWLKSVTQSHSNLVTCDLRPLTAACVALRMPSSALLWSICYDHLAAPSAQTSSAYPSAPPGSHPCSRSHSRCHMAKMWDRDLEFIFDSWLRCIVGTRPDCGVLNQIHAKESR